MALEWYRPSLSRLIQVTKLVNSPELGCLRFRLTHIFGQTPSAIGSNLAIECEQGEDIPNPCLPGRQELLVGVIHTGIALNLAFEGHIVAKDDRLPPFVGDISNPVFASDR